MHVVPFNCWVMDCVNDYLSLGCHIIYIVHYSSYIVFELFIGIPNEPKLETISLIKRLLSLLIVVYTDFRCLQSVILGCGREFNSFVDQDLLDLIFNALTHTNRFVRETGYYVCGALVTCGANSCCKFCFESVS